MSSLKIVAKKLYLNVNLTVPYTWSCQNLGLKMCGPVSALAVYSVQSCLLSSPTDLPTWCRGAGERDGTLRLMDNVEQLLDMEQHTAVKYTQKYLLKIVIVMIYVLLLPFSTKGEMEGGEISRNSTFTKM